MSCTSRLRSRPLRRFALVTGIALLALLPASVAGPTPGAKAEPPLDVNPVTDIDYNGSPGTTLDLYVPDFAGDAKLPLLIWTNGCAWLFPCGTSGTPDIAEEFNPQGYAVAGVSVAGTLFGARFPTQLDDIRAAIRWLRVHADDYNLDADRFAIMGFSSGGWTSVTAGTTSDDTQLPGEPDTNGLSAGVSSAVQAVVGFSSPTDFLQMDSWYEDNCPTPPGPRPPCTVITHNAPLDTNGDPAGIPLPGSFPAASPESLLVGCTDGASLFSIQYQTPSLDCQAMTETANPITYVDGDEVPMLLLHGENDPLVPNGQSQLLYEALAAAGNEATFVSVAGAGHSPVEIRAGTDFTVYHTNRGGQETVTDRPAPTWESIEHFIHVALSRGR
jgi:acetyl esterase/lipase